MKPSRRNVLLSLLLLGNSQAATLYWDGSNGSWLNSGNWSTDSVNPTPDPAAYPAATDDAIFNVSSVNAANTVTFNDNHAANSLVFNNTGTTTFVTDNVANRNLSVGAGGLTMASGAGTVTIGSATNVANQNIPINFTASQTWVNNSANNLILANNFTTNAGVNITKQGSGNVWMNNQNNNTVIAGNLDIQAGKILVSGDTTWNGVLSGAGNLENGGPAGKWVFQQGAGDSTFSGSLKDFSASVRLGLVKRNNEGVLTLSGTNQLGDRLEVDRGTIRITGNTTAGVSATANCQILVGNGGSVNSKLVIDGGTLTGLKNSSPTFAISGAANSAGQVKITSGTVTSASEYHIGRGNGSYAAHTQSGGSLTINNWLAVGLNNDRSVMNLSGGSVTVTANRMTVGAGGVGAIGVCNFSGGSFTSNAGIFLGENGTGTLNISGSHLYSTGTGGTTQFAGNATSLAGTLNLNGGTLSTNSVTKGTSSGTGVYRFHFAGGKLKATANNAAFFNDLALTDAYVYPGASTIDNGGFNVTLAEALRAPTGNGVSAAGLTVSGGGYMETPLVTITGGGGTGATAVANIDGSGNLTGITMTSPGIGYTSAPAFALVGGGFGNTGAIGGAATLVANSSGSMTFAGTGTTTITSPFTYAGGTTVSAGKLVLNAAFATSAGNITLANGTTLGITPTAKNTATPASTVTFGSSGASTLETNFGDQAGVNSTTAPLNVTGNVALNGVTTINVTGTKFAVGTLPLVSYAAKSGSGSFALGTLPAGVVATLVDSGSLISLNITSVALPRWKGNVDNLWDSATSNWVDQVTLLSSIYTDPNPVLFDDTATGSTNVVLNSTVLPSEVNYNNATLAYTLTGTGKISGTTGMVKKGAAALGISGILNDYTGVTRLEAGNTTVDSLPNGGVAGPFGASTSASTNLVLAGGTLTYSGASASTNRGFKLEAASSLSTTNDLAITGNVSSSGGSLTKLGTGTLSFTGTGTNTFGAGAAPAIRVDNGTLVFDGTAGSQINQVNNEIWGGNVPDVPAHLTVTNTTLNLVSWLALSRGNGSLGVCNFNMTNSTVNVGNFSCGFSNGLVANSSNTTITQTNTAFTNTGTTHIAESPGATTTWTLQGGSTYTAGNNFNIGGGGTGGSGTASGTVTLKDTSSILKNGAGVMQLGNSGGTGVLNLEGSSSLSVPTLEFYIANSGTSSATVNVKDSSTASFGATVFVGKSDVAGTGTAVGTLNQTGGTVNSGSWLVVGRYVGAQGFYNVSAGATNQTAAVTGTAMIIGEAGTGTLNVSGTGAVNVNGNFLSLAKVSTGVGTVNLDGGSITAKRVVEEAGGGTSTINFNGGVLKAGAASADFISVDTVDVKAGGAILNSNGFDITVLEPLSGVGALTKQGAGVLTLSTTLGYTGGTNVTGGTLALGTGTDLPTGGNLSVTGATFDLRNGFADRIVNVADLSLNNSTLIVGINGSSADTLTASGTVTATGTQTIKLMGNLNPGTYTLISSSAPLPGTYTLDTSGVAAGFITYSGAVVGNNYVLTVTGNATPADAYWKGDVSSIWSDSSLNPNSNWATSAAGTTDTQQIPGTTTDVYFLATGATNTTTTLGSNFTVDSLTFASGTSSVGGAQTLTLAGDNSNFQALEVQSGASASIGLSTLTYTGDTTVAAGGTLTVTGGSLGSSTAGAFVVDGTLNVNTVLAKGELSGSGTVTRSVLGTGILNVGGWADSTFSGIIQDGAGTVRLTKVGATMLTLTSANTHTGGTTLSAGQLTLANSAAVGTGTLTLSGGTLDNTTGSPLTLSNAVTLGGAWTYLGTNSLTLSGVLTSTSQPSVNIVASTLNLPNGITGNFGLVKTGDGILNLTGSVTSAATNATGVISFADGVTNYSSGTLQSTGAEIWVGNDPGNDATFNMGAGATINAVNWVAIGRSGGNGTLNMSGGTITKTTTTGNITIAGGTGAGQTGTLNQSGGLVTNTASQTWVGESATGIYNLSGAAVADLALVNIGTANAAGAIGIVNLNGGTFMTTQILKGGAAATGTFNFNGGTLQANTGAVGATFMSGLTAANVRNGGAIIHTNGQNLTVDQLLQHSILGGDSATDGGLVKNGTGSLTLTAANTYTGNTTVNAGTLSLSNAYLADTSTVVIASGATLNLSHASTDVVTGLTINGTPMANGVYGAVGSGAQFENAAITGTGKLQVGTDPYQSWADLKGLVGADRLTTADPDNDGMVNLLEYFLDGNPNAFTGPPSMSASGANLTLTFKRRDDAEADVASQFVEVSTNLSSWTSVAIPASSGVVGAVTFTITENGADPDDITASVAKGADVTKFLRVKVNE